MGGGRIDCYIDIASMYSYLAFVDLLANQEKLAAHGVTVDFHPVLLGGINAASGNKPPWTLPAKARYLVHDSRRSAARLGKPVKAPKDLMAWGMTVLPLRALIYIKRAYPLEVYLRTWHYLFACFWTAPNQNITKPDIFVRALGNMPADFAGELPKSQDSTHSSSEKTMFSPDEVQRIVRGANEPEIKDALKRGTQEALDHGAFGAPWLWVTDSSGHAEPFFGSDRFHFVHRFLGLPFQDITLLPPGESSGAKL